MPSFRVRYADGAVGVARWGESDGVVDVVIYDGRSFPFCAPKKKENKYLQPNNKAKAGNPF